MDPSRIIIIGAQGQLGRALQEQYPEATGADLTTLDISDPEAVFKFDWGRFDYILNAAAYTNVDGAESPEGRAVAWKVNGVAPSLLAQVASRHNKTLVHISTDYVFDGSQKVHTESEELSPLSVYGASKAAGDIAVGITEKRYILRTSWVIGDGKNFVRTMLGVGEKGISPTVVADQVGRLTFTGELVRAIDFLLKHSHPYGTYNVSNEGEPASWAQITRNIFDAAGFNLSVTDTTTADYFAGKTGIAPRPLSSVLALQKIQALGFESRDWQHELREYIASERNKEQQ